MQQLAVARVSAQYVKHGQPVGLAVFLDQPILERGELDAVGFVEQFAVQCCQWCDRHRLPD
ncbi:hypothetical protein D3C81_1955050 [compost metagenome]